MNSLKSFQNEFFLIARFAAYILVILGVTGVMFLDAKAAGGTNRFGENSFVEMTQLGVLLAVTALCLVLCFQRKAYSRAALLLAGFFAASFVREGDAFWDKCVFDGCWQVLAYTISIFVLWRTWVNRRSFMEEMKTYLHSVAGGLFMGGFLTTYVFSRLLGRKIFWQTFLGENYLRDIKNAAEECTELLGYTLLLFSVVELVLMAWRKNTVTRAVTVTSSASQQPE